MRGLLERVGAPAISSVKVEVRETAVAPDGALTRPKRSYSNATHRDCRLEEEGGKGEEGETGDRQFSPDRRRLRERQSDINS